MIGTAALVIAGVIAGVALTCRLRSLPPIEAPDAVLVAATSVVIPARNEATTLPRLLRSLADQRLAPLEVLVVDDDSADGTAEVARAGGARVITVDGPPAGWTGKTWACHRGITEAVGDRIVLLDADTWLGPDALARLVHAHAVLVPDGLLSVAPRHVTERAHEQLSAACNVVTVMGSGAGRPGADERSMLAFGPCLVVGRAALTAVGGFAAVRHDPVEDIALAQAFHRADRPVRTLAGGRDVQYRMYPDGLRSLVEGWTKNLSSGARRAPLVARAGTVIWVSGTLGAAMAPLTSPPASAAALYVAGALSFGSVLRRIGSFRWWSVAAYPVPLLAFVGLFVHSAVVRTGRGRVTWRGRQIEVRTG